MRTPTARPTSRLVAAPLALFLVVLAVYLANGRTIGAGDTLPAAHLPWSLLRQQNFDLDEFPALYDDTARAMYPLLDGIPYYLQSRSGHYLSAYASGAAVVALPVYLLPVLMGAPPDGRWPDHLEKLAAAAITALSVVLLFLALEQVATRGWALAIALVYAFGTSSLSMSAQGLWQHGPSQLFLALALYCLVRGLRDARYLGRAGFPMAAAVAMRSTDLLLVLPVAAWIAWRHHRRLPSLVLWALPPIAALGLYHGLYFAVPDRGLGSTTAPLWAFFTQMPLHEGLAGVLVSPSRGLFVYSPVLLFSLAGMAAVWRRGPGLWRALSLGPPLVVLLIGKWVTWWGGHSWGPRLLADTAPILCFLLYPLAPHLDRRRLAKALFALCALWSVLAHALGAWYYDRRWDAFATEGQHARLWPWTDSPLAFYAREALLGLGGPGRARPDGAAGGAGTGWLAAAYEAGRAPLEVMSGERFVLPVSARNTGQEAWPAAAPGDRGAVRLGWRWHLGEQEAAAGREFLLADVRPGRSVRFEARIIAPPAPGDYVLSVGLVSEFVGWFGDHGDRPIRLPVRVVPRDVAAMLSGPIGPGAPAPVAAIATDRPSYRSGDTLGLTVTFDNPHRPRSFDAYLVLERPGGPPLFFDGHAPPRPPGASWPPWVKGLPLPARASARFAIPVSGPPCATCRWHVVLAEAGSYHAVARATAGFAIEP